MLHTEAEMPSLPETADDRPQRRARQHIEEADVPRPQTRALVAVGAFAEERSEEQQNSSVVSGLHDVRCERERVDASQKGRALDRAVTLLHGTLRVVRELQANHHRDGLNGAHEEQVRLGLDPAEHVLHQRGGVAEEVGNATHDAQSGQNAAVHPVVLDVLRVGEEETEGAAEEAEGEYCRMAKAPLSSLVVR